MNEYTQEHNKRIAVCLKKQGFTNLRQYKMPTIFWKNQGTNTHITQRGACNGLCGDDWRLLASSIEHNGTLYMVDLDNIESSIIHHLQTIQGAHNAWRYTAHMARLCSSHNHRSLLSNGRLVLLWRSHQIKDYHADLLLQRRSCQIHRQDRDNPRWVVLWDRTLRRPPQRSNQVDTTGACMILISIVALCIVLDMIDDALKWTNQWKKPNEQTHARALARL